VKEAPASTSISNFPHMKQNQLTQQKNSLERTMIAALQMDFNLLHYFEAVRLNRMADGSHVVLLIAGDQRRKVLMKYIESLNIKVSYVKQGKNLLPQLERIKQKLDISYFSFLEKTQMGSLDFLNKTASFNSDSEANYVPSCSNSKSSSAGIMLVVIDAGAGPFSDLSSAVVNFSKDIQNSRCKVVWLDHPTDHVAHSEDPPYDHIVYKPLHGWRLYQVLGLIPELKRFNLPELVDNNSLNEFSCNVLELGESSSHQMVIHRHDERSTESTDNKPLDGKKVLLVEDNPVLRRVTTCNLCKLGANVEICENGKEAFDQICKLFSDQRKEGPSNSLPYDYVFMDCEVIFQTKSQLYFHFAKIQTCTFIHSLENFGKQ